MTTGSASPYASAGTGFLLCQGMDASLERFRDDLAEISEQYDALIEMAIDLDRETAIAAGASPDRPLNGTRRTP